MFIHYRTQGFILRKVDRGEADQLFTIYTEKFGKLEVLGKAIRKISSKLRSGADIFYLSNIEFIQGKAHKTLTDAILINNFKNLRLQPALPSSQPSAGPQDLKRLAVAFKISEALDNLVKGQEPEDNIWNLLRDVFEKLNDLRFKIYDLRLIYYYFLWNLLSVLGYELGLYNCSICQKKLIPQNIYFTPKEGGLICQNCFKKLQSVEEGKSSSSLATLSRGARKSGSSFDFAAARVGKEINPEIVKILRIIYKKDWPTISKLKIEKSHLNSLKVISEECYSYFHNN